MRKHAPIPGSSLALVRLQDRLRRRLKLFREITGLTAVASVASSLSESGKEPALAPPVHPRCAKRLRSVRSAPCGEQWMLHLRRGRRSGRAHSHTCPLRLRCSCVPVRFGGQLVGVAKVVADPETLDSAFAAAMSVLDLVVSESCQDSMVSVLSDEVRDLRHRVSDLRQIQPGARGGGAGSGSPVEAPGSAEADDRAAALVIRALAHLERHHLDPDLTLSAVAAAVRCNPRYLTTRFTAVVGERMHRYLLALRVAHACRLLIGTDLRIKEIAFASGFTGAGRMSSAFRRRVGVSPGDYRRIFSAS